MKKIIYTLLLLSFCQTILAQYNNEWIDYSKTYYKIKVASKGMFRISQPVLANLGLQNQQAQSFQLWRNGVQQPLFTSVSTGLLPVNGYLEFYGEPNDGKVDRALYRNANDQLSDRTSLFTDTAIYFLTVNPAGNNLRFAQQINNLSGTLPAPATHVWAFVHHQYFSHNNNRPRIHKGKAENYGEYVYSSAYDQGEMPVSADIYPNQTPGSDWTNYQAKFENLMPYTAGGLQAKIRISIAGSAFNIRSVRFGLNNAELGTRTYTRFDARIDSFTAVSPNLLLEPNTVISISNQSTNLFDRVVAGFAEITYARLPNAGGQNQFNFHLPASAQATYLEITNFDHGGQSPVLINNTLQQRMTADLGVGGVVRLLIPASAQPQYFLLTSQQSAASFTPVTQLVQRNFVAYAQSQNQGNYLIITNQRLLAGGSTNAVNQYAQYRASALGGAFKPVVYDIEQLVDQFAFGVKMHPLGIKNFLRYARQQFATAPQYCFLIGRGVNYIDFREKENHPNALNIQLVPTFGNPASDNSLASNDNTALPATPIGRLSAISEEEIADYLAKVKEHEQAQANTSTLQADNLWKKNIVHVVGANDAGTASLITPYMNSYSRTISDTLFGGKVTTFNKFNTTTASTIENDQLASLFQNGFSLLTYFGHSSATALDYNLDDPSQYNNPGKYPVILLNGCNAGNFFDFDTARQTIRSTISEKYVLAKNRGSIALIASTHFGIVNGLGLYSNGFYNSIARKSYLQSLGKNVQDAIQLMYQTWGASEFQARIHSEQQTLHGDPAIRIHAAAKPDYSVEPANIIVNPSFLSISETQFKVKIYHYNLGKAINDSITVEVKRQYPATAMNPNGATETVYRKKIKATLNVDSLDLTLGIESERDKGINKIIVSVETDNRISEISESNNTASTDVVIFEDDLRPAYPYPFAIIQKPDQKLIGTTSNPFSATRTYRMELDTSATFNSSTKITRDIISKGGVLEFDPAITYTDSTVYYWRLAVVPTTGAPTRWNQQSFVYLKGTETGFNQSHFWQHRQSMGQRMNMDSASRQWTYQPYQANLLVTQGIFNTPSYGDDNDLLVSVNATNIIQSGCEGHSIRITVFDPITFKPIKNNNGQYGSTACAVSNNFEWDDRTAANRRKIMDFMDSMPNGAYFVIRKNLDPPYENETYASVMKADEAQFGPGKSLYHKLKTAGFEAIDSFNKPSTFIFIYRKNSPEFKPRWAFSTGLDRRAEIQIGIPIKDTMGVVTSPLFGPAKAWKQVQWRGNSIDQKPGDLIQISVIGVSATGTETLLYKLNEQQQNFDISSVSANSYPFIKLAMRNADSINGTPYQLRYWRLYFTPVPEGALAGNLLLESKDTVYQGEIIPFKIAFKNISATAFADSLRLLAYITDKNNVRHPIQLNRKKDLIPGDTTQISFDIDTRNFPGINTLYLAANPNNDQPEQYFFNNFLYKSILVSVDKFNPLVDVTFDGIHILNRDIVSSKPHIQIKLTDENRFLALNDTSGLQLQLKYPGQQQPRTFKWGNDTLRFTPPTNASNNNSALIDFTPTLLNDSENSEYELTLSGKDRLGNKTTLDYRISFQVFNKPMISNLLNYPNPFSTSTAFVFTITGHELPQEFKIQIMTVTGKIVKEITKMELGDLRIGTNITEYKWDGTDTYGQKLANGVYLYRVVSSLDGKQLDRFKLNDSFDQQGVDVTDQYFKKGYGKMVILR